MSQKNEFGQPLGDSVLDWHSRRRPNFDVLQGEHCSVVPIDISKHAESLFGNLSLNNRGESWTYLPYGPFSHYREFSAWIKKTSAEIDTMLYAILNKHQEAIGIAGFMRIYPEHGSIEVGHLHYSPLLKQTIAATEAMYLMMSYTFDSLGYRRYEWKCNSLNLSSVQAALRLGFTFEGTFRQSHVLKGLNRDTSWFSIIDREWPNLKRKFLHWLDATNFDKNGQQIMKLSEA